MNYLLDTHTFLWLNIEPEKLSRKVAQLVTEPQNEIYVSAATAWEISIKYGNGKLELPLPPDRWIQARITQNAYVHLPILVSHASAVHKLPDIHRDPFDRLLICQSQLENMPLVTKDPLIQKYGVEMIW